MTFIDLFKIRPNGARSSPSSSMDLSTARQKAGLRGEVTRLKNGETAKVVELRGSDRIIRKLEAMGIMPGMTIRKKSNSPMGGPIVLEKGGMLFAVGRGLAHRIIVEAAGSQPP